MKVTFPPDKLPIFVDPTRLTQVIANLIDNAVKFTPSNGCIEVEASRLENNAIVRVRDNGYGISSEDLPYLFNIFVQGKGRGCTDVRGIGVGLSIVRKLVELHGGHVEARSEGLGKGSEFIIVLPLDDIAHPVVAKES